jgi:RNA polymerase sigma-70 factor, ECF subfamily
VLRVGAMSDTHLGDTGSTQDDAYDAFFRREYPVMVSLGVALTGDRELARDIAQESMLRAYNHWSQLVTLDRPGAWCRQVAINLVRDGWRRRRSEEAAMGRLRRERIHAVPAPRSPSDEFWAAVRALPGRQREAIALYYLADRSVGEIAATLGIAQGTVKGVLFDARQTLAARLGVREDWEES